MRSIRGSSTRKRIAHATNTLPNMVVVAEAVIPLPNMTRLYIYMTRITATTTTTVPGLLPLLPLLLLPYPDYCHYYYYRTRITATTTTTVPGLLASSDRKKSPSTCMSGGYCECMRGGYSECMRGGYSECMRGGYSECMRGYLRARPQVRGLRPMRSHRRAYSRWQTGALVVGQSDVMRW
jgi:hypothetical protein